jgi:hypothetical protein
MPIKPGISERKEKVGTVLDIHVIRKVKERSAKEGRTISDIIQEALIKYDEIDLTKAELRKTAVDRFCSKPFNLNISEVNELLNEDIYEL